MNFLETNKKIKIITGIFFVCALILPTSKIFASSCGQTDGTQCFDISPTWPLEIDCETFQSCDPSRVSGYQAPQQNTSIPDCSAAVSEEIAASGDAGGAEASFNGNNLQNLPQEDIATLKQRLATAQASNTNWFFDTPLVTSLKEQIATAEKTLADSIKKNSKPATTPTTKSTVCKTVAKPAVTPKAAVTTATAPSATAGIVTRTDAAREFIDILRRQAKFDLPLNNPDANLSQKNFEANLAIAKEALDMVDNVQRLKDLLNKIESPVKGVDDGDFEISAPKILTLIDKIRNFDTSKDSLSESFTELKKYIPSFNDATWAPFIDNNLKLLSGFQSYWMGKNGAVQKTTDTLYTTITALQLYQKWAGQATDYSTVPNVKDAPNLYNTQFKNMKVSITELYTGLNTLQLKVPSIDSNKLSNLSYGLELLSKNAAVNNAICLGMSAKNKGGGSSDGFPSEEQSGALLDYTGQLIDYSASIRAIDQTTCVMTLGILTNTDLLVKKEYELDPRIREDARKLLEAERTKSEKMIKEGREVDGSKELGTFAPVLESYQSEVTKKALYLLENVVTDSKTPAKKSLAANLATEAEINKDEALKRALAPLPTDDSGPWGSFYSQGIPQNTAVGVQITINAEKERRVNEALKNAELRYLAGGGILANETCVDGKWVIGSDGNPYCTQRQMVTPAIIMGRTAGDLATTNIRQGENAREYGESDTVRQIAKTVDSIYQYETDTSLEGITLTSDDNLQQDNFTSSLSTIKSSLQGGGETGTTENKPGPATDFPAPKISQSSKTTHGVKVTTITWDGNNSGGKTTNNWVSYNGLTSTVVKKSGETLDAGSIDIVHPTVFSFNASASGSSLLGATQNTQTNFSTTIVKEGAGARQTTTFTPNIDAQLRPGDSITVTIGGTPCLVTFEEDFTPADINNALSKIIKTKLPAYDTEFSGNSLIISRSVNQFPASADYKMTFSNSSGNTSNTRISDITVDFL